MKKIIAAVIACLFIASAFAGCGIGDPLNNNSSKSSSSSSSSKEKSTSSKTESKKTENTKTYKDSFDGLVSYMKDKGYITSDSVKQSSDEKLPTIKGVDKDYGYEYIGAEKGVKYPNQNITIELYSFKNPEKNDYVQSVKKDGKFTLFGIDIEAYLTTSRTETPSPTTIRQRSSQLRSSKPSIPQKNKLYIEMSDRKRCRTIFCSIR